MTNELFLPLEPLVVPPPALTLEERFADFRLANPHVERLLVQYARELMAMGHTRLSMKMLWERVRFEYATRTKGDSRAALNNDYTALFARRLMATYPDLDGVFETRQRRAA